MGRRTFEWPFSTGALRQNARLLAEAPIQSADVGMCNSNVFLLRAGLGLDAITIRQLEPRPDNRSSAPTLH